MSEAVKIILGGNGVSLDSPAMANAIASDVQNGNQAVQEAINAGYIKGKPVTFIYDNKRTGTIIAYNENMRGFYSADSYPVIVQWKGELRPFEYGTDDLQLI